MMLKKSIFNNLNLVLRRHCNQPLSNNLSVILNIYPKVKKLLLLKTIGITFA